MYNMSFNVKLINMKQKGIKSTRERENIDKIGDERIKSE